MIRQDFILRMIEQAAQMIARVFELGKDGDLVGALELENETASKFLELTSENLEKWDDEKIFSHLRSCGSPLEFPLRLGVALSLLDARGLALRNSGNKEQATELFAKATGVLLRSKIESQTADVPEFAPGLEDFLARVPPEGLPARLSCLLICYYEHVGQYAEAEDALYQLQDVVGTDSEIKQLGVGFYERLLRHSEEKLVRGDLPRAEVEQGAIQWQRLF